MSNDKPPLHMVDVLGQYAHIQDDIDKAVLDVVKSGQYINGPAVRDFAQELAQWLGHSESQPVHVIPCANGTDALQAALMALDLKPGDEIITPSFTFISTVEVIHLLRLKPVMVDVDPCSFTLDPGAVAKAITDRTKAIMPVHLYGQCAEMTALMTLAKTHDLAIVEDTAQAIGSGWSLGENHWGAAGTMGDIGTTSFFPSKNLGAYGDGGACFTRDAALAQKLKMICNHGSQKRYSHEIIGMNSRLDSIQAAILRVKLPHLSNYNAARTAAADKYDALLGEHPMITVPYRHPRSKHVFHQYTLKLNNRGEGPGLRDHLAQHLTARGIPHGVYYPKPIHKQAAFADVVSESVVLPHTEDLTQRVISLPMHTELTEAQQERVAQHIQEGLNSYL